MEEQRRLHPGIFMSESPPPTEDPVTYPGHTQDGPSQLLYRERWASIRSHNRESKKGRFSVYNMRLNNNLSQEDVDHYLDSIFRRQRRVFSLDLSLGCILTHQETGRMRYFHASHNNHRLFEHSVKVYNQRDMEEVKKATDVSSFTEMASRNRTSTKWSLMTLTNLSCYVIHHAHKPMGGGKRNGWKNNKMKGVRIIPKTKRNLCFFLCLIAHSQEKEKKKRKRLIRCQSEAIRLAMKWMRHNGDDVRMLDYQGVTLRDLNSLCKFFKIGLRIYKMEEKQGQKSAFLERRELDHQFVDIMNLHLNDEEDHLDYITDMDSYSYSYTCKSCKQYFVARWNCMRHEATCDRSTKWTYVGGPYHPKRNAFEDLDKAGVHVGSHSRFHQYRVAYDFESFLTPQCTSHSPAGYKNSHVPMSVSIVSNIPGYEEEQCLISEGCPQELINRFLNLLWKMSDRAYDLYREYYKDIIKEIESIEMDLIEEHNWIQLLHTDECPKSSKAKTRHDTGNFVITQASKKFHTWMRSLPVVGFNSSRYDMNLIKPYIVKALAKVEEEEEDEVPMALEEEMEVTEKCEVDRFVYVIKKANAVTCFSTRKLTFLDVMNYLAPGVSLVKYLKAYGGEIEGKSFFPYEYVSSLERLNETRMPPYDAFYSSMRNENTLEEGKGPERGHKNYEELCEIWEKQEMKSIRDLLKFYNRRDTVPFLEALNKQIAVYRDMGLDLLKDAPTLPGLSLRYSMRGLEGTFHTFGPDQADIFNLIKKNIVGGPAIVFCRWAEVDKTKIKERLYGQDALVCKAVHGVDANSLYPYCMYQPMPVGPCWTRTAPDFARKDVDIGPRQSLAALEWMEYKEDVLGRKIHHAGNGPEVKVSGF